MYIYIYTYIHTYIHTYIGVSNYVGMEYLHLLVSQPGRSGLNDFCFVDHPQVDIEDAEHEAVPQIVPCRSCDGSTTTEAFPVDL